MKFRGQMFLAGCFELHHQERFRVQQGDADVPSLENRKQKVWTDLSNGRRRESFRQRSQNSNSGSSRW